MSRWIDGEWLSKLFPDTGEGDWTYNATAQGYIDSAPSIEIIRCGECKYWKSTVQMPNGTEVKCLYGRKADGFCSYGEREGE